MFANQIPWILLSNTAEEIILHLKGTCEQTYLQASFLFIIHVPSHSASLSFRSVSQV